MKLQNEFQLEIEESDTKHTPNGLVKKYDKNNAQWTFIVFFDKPIGVCLVPDSSIANRHSFCLFQFKFKGFSLGYLTLL